MGNKGAEGSEELTMKNVAGKVIVITGASSGIGRETARQLVAAGAKVALSARRESRLREIAEELGTDNVAYLPGDATSLDDMQALVALAKERFGKVDSIFANAGIMPAGNMSELKVDEWMAEVDVNVKGVLNLIAAAMPQFKEQGYGHVIATSSMAGLQSVPGNAVYCGTKHFVRALLSSLRAESVQEGSRIRTTTVYPGAVNTELLNTVDAGEGKEMAQKLYDAVAIQPADIARAVVFAVAQPDGVDISDIAVQPLLQP